MKKILTILAAALTMGASAQTMTSYNGRIGLSNVINPSDEQLQEVGKRIGALPMPTKAEAATMLKQAIKAGSARRMARANAERYNAKYSAQDTVMWESWESWNGIDFNWRPGYWEYDSKVDKKYIDELTGACPTWACFKGDGYYTPYATHGDFFLVCQNSEEVYEADEVTVKYEAPEQDEWMVRSVPKSVSGSNFISFDLAYSPFYSHYFIEDGKPVIKMDKLAYDVEVLVAEQDVFTSFDEEDYVKVFKLSDIVDEMMKDADLEDEKTIAQLMNMRWQHFKISLAEFDGMDIDLAFRYKGCKGGAVLLDAVRISDMLPVAKYDRPEGSFYFGFSDQAQLLYMKNSLIPAYADAVWTNYSNADAENISWAYKVDGEDKSSLDYNLTMEAPKPGSMDWPTLTASAGIRSDVFNGGADLELNGQKVHSDNGWCKIGGNGMLDLGGAQYNFTLGNFDPTKYTWNAPLGDGAYAFGTGSGYFWSQMTNQQYNAVEGIANVYDKPAAPYVFSSVILPLGDFFNMGANLTCTVYKAKELENGAMEITEEVLGQTSTTDATQLTGGYILNFTFNNIMVVDCPIAIAVTGVDNDNLLTFAPVTQALNHDSNKGYAFVILKNQGTKGTWWVEVASALSAAEGGGNMQVSHCIGMNAVFPYLHSNDGNIYAANTAGETKNFDIDSFWYPTKTTAADVLNGWTIECSESWVSAQGLVEGQNAVLKTTIKPMPAGVTGRVAEVKIKALGCEETITITQGDVTGISDVNENVNDNDNENIYDLTGRKVKDSSKAGIYIVNGKKIIK